MSDELLLTLGSVLSLGSVMSRSSRRTAPWSSPFALDMKMKSRSALTPRISHEVTTTSNKQNIPNIVAGRATQVASHHLLF